MWLRDRRDAPGHGVPSLTRASATTTGGISAVSLPIPSAKVGAVVKIYAATLGNGQAPFWMTACTSLR